MIDNQEESGHCLAEGQPLDNCKCSCPWAKSNRQSQHYKTASVILSVLVPIVTLIVTIPQAEGQQSFSPWRPPWGDGPYNPEVVVRTYYGDVRGFSVPWHIDDEIWNPEWEEEPPWYTRRINCFLGVPYAQPPLGKLRFQKPRRPRWGIIWEAKHFRHACPQDLSEVRLDIPDFPHSNMSEDCLYMNIFAPNLTRDAADVLYPVIVYIHGGDYIQGTAQQYPGHVLVTQEVVVVTFNYRLGALGWLTTEDHHAAGNWGLWDQHLALEFVKENIKGFRGDPNNIMLMGEGAGASSVGMHLISPLSRTPGMYFHKAALMSGSELSPFGYVKPFWRPREYAIRLADRLGCPTDDSFSMVDCLRDNKTIFWQTILDVSKNIEPNDGKFGIVWGPVQDGGYYYGQYKQESFLPETPTDLRRQELFARIPIIAGVNLNDGARKANESVHGICNGMFPATFEQFVHKMLQDWRIQDLYDNRAYEALEFQYTWWPDPENLTARAQEFINMVGDYGYGAGVDTVIKQHAEYESSYQYVFEFKSWNDWLPWCYGVSYSAIVPYVFGWPFMNETILNETELLARQWYDYEDRNISEFMMTMWTNFAKYDNPTPNITRNVTWEPFNDYNLTYLIIDWHSHIWFRYRQLQYGFWNEYFPSIAKQDYYFPTATPTPAGIEYVYATGGMGAVLFILFLMLGGCIYLLVLQSQQEYERDAYAESELPLSFSRSQSESTVSRRSPYNVDYHSPYAASEV